MPDNLTSIVIGLTIVAVGLALFIRGLELGIFPVGENLAIDFAKKRFYPFGCYYLRLPLVLQLQ